jgi:DnaK suppressor protein
MARRKITPAFLGKGMVTRGSAPMQAPTRKKKVNPETYRKLLMEKREELIGRLYERRSQIAGEREPDDEGAFALQDVIKDLALTNMEREIRTLTEVELSLRLMESGQYGLCGSCGDEIPTARLQALPWTRICVACAGGGIKGAERESEDAAKQDDLPVGVLRFEKRAR